MTDLTDKNKTNRKSNKYKDKTKEHSFTKIYGIQLDKMPYWTLCNLGYFQPLLVGNNQEL